MKLKKRKKTSRLRGSRTAGWGFRQKHKGHGNRGGGGMAGSGKRADHKKQKALKLAKEAGAKKGYFGGGGFTSRRTAKKVNNVLNLTEVRKRFGEGKIELKEYKILGKGDGFKGEIIAGAASKTAIEKMEKVGGKIVLPVVEVEKKVEREEGGVGENGKKAKPKKNT